MAGHSTNMQLQRIDFIIDSGASHHIVSNCSFFENYVKLNQLVEIQTAKKGFCIHATKQGNIRIAPNTGQKGVLEGVLYCLEAPANLLSVRKFQMAGFQTTFHAAGFISIKGKENTIIIGKSTNSLPNLKLNLNAPIAATSAHVWNLKSNYDLWHKRLGHLRGGNG